MSAEWNLPKYSKVQSRDKSYQEWTELEPSFQWQNIKRELTLGTQIIVRQQQTRPHEKWRGKKTGAWESKYEPKLELLLRKETNYLQPCLSQLLAQRIRTAFLCLSVNCILNVWWAGVPNCPEHLFMKPRLKFWRCSRDPRALQFHSF